MGGCSSSISSKHYNVVTLRSVLEDTIYTELHITYMYTNNLTTRCYDDGLVQALAFDIGIIALSHLLHSITGSLALNFMSVYTLYKMDLLGEVLRVCVCVSFREWLDMFVFALLVCLYGRLRYGCCACTRKFNGVSGLD